MTLSDQLSICAEDINFEETTTSMVKPSIDPLLDRSNSNNVSDLLDDVAGDLEGYLADTERQILDQALMKNRWNKTATARALGITFRSLRYRLKKLGLDD